MTIAIPLCDGEHFLLSGVALLTLNQAIGPLGEHRSVTGEIAITNVELVCGVACNHEEGNSPANLRYPLGLFVEAREDGGLGCVVPQQRVALVGDKKWDTESWTACGLIVSPTLDFVPAVVKIAFLISPQAVVILVFRRGEGCSYPVERGIFRPPIIVKIEIAILVVKHCHLPPLHVQQRLAIGGDAKVSAAIGSVEIPLWAAIERAIGPAHWRSGRGEEQVHARRLDGVAFGSFFVTPAAELWFAHDAVAGRCRDLILECAESDPDDVERVRFNCDSAAIPFDNDRAGL